MPTYFGALLFGLPVWLLLFYYRPDLRHKMLIMSILVALIAPVDTFFIPEYWSPVILGRLFSLHIDIFTILFGFFMGGISAVLYEETMGKTYVRNRREHHPWKFLIALGPVTLFLFEAFSSFNFMISVLIATIMMVVLIVLIRPDLIFDALLSGLFFAVVYSVLLSLYIFMFPDVLRAWNFERFPQALVFNLPHYEIIWAFVSGAFLGPLYEFSHDFILRGMRRRLN